MQMKKEKMAVLYKMYLLECLFQDFDEKIDNPPMDYQLFVKRLKNIENSDIIKKKI